ncbi:hypothetical protein [Actinomadura craniellae]|uniref:hypothetical protein n=1 Tax=Actinomadura craniellae TaxID=2231787 RepID=UPI0018F24B25|nr:hypothetical protein [Actinomadura craniellae]
MRLFKRPGRTRKTRRTPSLRELRAQRRTQEAEAKLLETQARIHREAERIRGQYT